MFVSANVLGFSAENGEYRKCKGKLWQDDLKKVLFKKLKN